MSNNNSSSVFMDKRFNSFAIAWCVELNKQVYAKDVPLLQEIYSDLTFQCCECRKPLFFHVYQEDFQIIASFIQKTDGAYDANLLRDHEACLKALIAKKAIPHDIFAYEAFESAFAQVDFLQKETEKALCLLKEAFLLLRDTVFLNPDPKAPNPSAPLSLSNPSTMSPAELLRRIDIALQDMTGTHEFFYKDFGCVSSAYTTLRHATKGF